MGIQKKSLIGSSTKKSAPSAESGKAAIAKSTSNKMTLSKTPILSKMPVLSKRMGV